MQNANLIEKSETLQNIYIFFSSFKIYLFYLFIYLFKSLFTVGIDDSQS